MDSETRLRATKYVWIGFFFALLVANADIVINGASLDIGHFLMTAVVGIVALVSSGVIWNWGDLPTTGVSSEQASEKSKRRSRIQSLLDEMDARDIEELRNRLRLGDEEDEVEMVITADGELEERYVK